MYFDLKATALALGGAALLAASALPAQAATVTIADTQSNVNTFFGNHDTSVLFDPLTGATTVTVTGSVDISGFATAANENNVLMVGLLSKVDFDAEPPGGNFFGLLDTAYASFGYADGNKQFYAGLGQGNGDTTQTYFGGNPNSDDPTALNDGTLGDGEFTITFGAAGVTFEVLGSSITMPYDVSVDFSQGGYAFAGVFINQQGGAATFDLTFEGPGTAAAVPEPATLALLGAGLAGLGLVRRRRKA